MADDEEEVPRAAWEGAWDEEGLPHGEGKMTYPPKPVGEDEEEKPGDTYEGTFEHGKRHGKGKYTWGITGAVYTGEYQDNKKHGEGVMSYPDKSVFSGEWVNDLIEGHGEFTYGNGDRYLGAFLAGKRHGKGAYHYKAIGSQMVGEWEAGGMVKGKWIYKDGSTFSGTFAKGVEPAEGAYFFSTSKLLQPGKFTEAGTWSVEAPPVIGTVDGLEELVPGMKELIV